jgi:hypothetical protein
MSFKFELAQRVRITESGETGFVKGRAEYSTHENCYWLHYKAGDGRAVESWWDESLIEVVGDNG